MGLPLAKVSLDHLSDEELIQRFNAGEGRALETLLEKYRRPLYNFIYRSVRDKAMAEDLLQDTFIRVIQRSGDFKGESKFATWLYTIARNLCIDTSRKMVFRRHKSLDAPTVRDGDDGPALVERIAGRPAVDREAIATQLQTQISQAVEALPEEQREVFLLREVANLPFKEIAEMMQVPENTVKSRMRYALERLQEALAEYEDYAQALK